MRVPCLLVLAYATTGLEFVRHALLPSVANAVPTQVPALRLRAEFRFLGWPLLVIAVPKQDIRTWKGKAP
jgi:hypothetical protein